MVVGRLGTEQLQMTQEHLDLCFEEGLWEAVGVLAAEQEEQLPDLDMNDSFCVKPCLLVVVPTQI